VEISRFVNKSPKNQPINCSITPVQKTSLRAAYNEYAIDEYYKKFGDRYQNPHAPIITELLKLAHQKWQLPGDFVLDLACGSGEVTSSLVQMGITNVEGIDPFTYRNYQARTGKSVEQYSFEDIAAGALTGSTENNEENKKYSLIICSFALHLVPISRLPLLLYQLGLLSEYLLVVTPHKRPEIKSTWGWVCLGEISWKKVRARLYQLA
jgi:SAM-dependent methyltransferase